VTTAAVSALQAIWVSLRIDHPEGARQALATLADAEYTALCQAIGAAVEQSPSLAAALLPPDEWLEHRRQVLARLPAAEQDRPQKTTPFLRLVTANG